MLTLRQRIFLISGIGVGLLLAAVLFLLYRGKAVKEAAPDEEPAVSAPAEPGAGYGRVERFIPPPTQYSPDESAVRNISRIFVERFGSYSTINRNSNIDDAVALATPRMASWLEERRHGVGAVYEGTTTRVMAMTVRSVSAGAAEVEVRAEQFVSDGSGAPEIESRVQRTGRVELLKDGVEWKVNGFYWED